MGIDVRERYINPYTDSGFEEWFDTEQNKEIKKRLFDQAEIAQFTQDERREYAESVKDYWDYYSTMKTAHKKGKVEGLAEGEAKGRAEGRCRQVRCPDNLQSERSATFCSAEGRQRHRREESGGEVTSSDGWE